MYSEHYCSSDNDW